MASSSGNSTGTVTTVTLRNSSSGEDLQQLMSEKKRKRMQSNRESARRSRMRKQKHMDELTAKVAVLRRDNGQILNAVNVTSQQVLAVEAENSVLRAQLAELATRLDSLTGILDYLNSPAPPAAGFDGVLGNQWCANQPLMASADCQLFGY